MTATINRADKTQRSAWNRAYHGYIRNALEPTSAAVFGDLTVNEVKAAARQWADENWIEYVQ
jgi:hypothetical protein